MNMIDGKVAYITGGTKGIGYGIAKALLEKGMKVAITGRSLPAAVKAAESLSTDPSKILALESDVSSMASEKKAVDAAIAHFGRLDVVVANAGVGHFASIEDISEELWKETIDTNLTGVFNTVKPALIR
jgi:3-oxoacyl-[acyl-carrier protein] reductase